jgi:hypothetical protein
MADRGFRAYFVDAIVESSLRLEAHALDQRRAAWRKRLRVDCVELAYALFRLPLYALWGAAAAGRLVGMFAVGVLGLMCTVFIFRISIASVECHMALVAHTLDAREPLRPYCADPDGSVVMKLLRLVCEFVDIFRRDFWRPRPLMPECVPHPAHEIARAYVALNPDELLGDPRTKGRLDACVALGII